jgi:hypothetical protein
VGQGPVSPRRTDERTERGTPRRLLRTQPDAKGILSAHVPDGCPDPCCSLMDDFPMSDKKIPMSPRTLLKLVPKFLKPKNSKGSSEKKELTRLAEQDLKNKGLGESRSSSGTNESNSASTTPAKSPKTTSQPTRKEIDSGSRSPRRTARSPRGPVTPRTKGERPKLLTDTHPATQFSTFADAFRKICAAHDQRSAEMGKTYAVGSNGQPALQDFLESEIQSSGFSQRWNKEIRTQFRAVYAALVKNRFIFKDWQELRTSIENSPEFQSMRPASPHGPESLGSTQRQRGGVTTNQKSTLFKYFEELKDLRSDLEFDQLILLFVIEAKKNHLDFPDSVFDDVITKMVSEHNISTGENVSDKYALEAVKNYDLQVPGVASRSNIRGRNEKDFHPSEKSRGFSDRLTLDNTPVRLPNVRSENRPDNSRGFDRRITVASGNSADIVRYTPLDLETPVGGFGLRPLAVGLQSSISPLTSPGRNTYQQPMNPSLNQQPMQPYQQHQPNPQGAQFGNNDNTSEDTLFDRILADAPKQ